MWGGRSKSVEFLYTIEINFLAQIDCCNHKMFYISLVVITKGEKTIVYTQQIKREQSKHTTKNHQITKEDNRRGGKGEKKDGKIVRKQ